MPPTLLGRLSIRLMILPLLVACLALAAGCSSVVVRERTLPPSVRTVYVPMIENRTQEPGVEEDLTVELEKELLADGRLGVVREKEADAIVRIILTRFDTMPQTFDEDDFATRKTYDVEAILEIQENIPGRPIIGGRRVVSVSTGYNDDPRSISYEPEPVNKETLSQTFARAAVLELLTGTFEVDATGGEEQGTPKDPSISISTNN